MQLSRRALVGVLVCLASLLVLAARFRGREPGPAGEPSARLSRPSARSALERPFAVPARPRPMAPAFRDRQLAASVQIRSSGAAPVVITPARLLDGFHSVRQDAERCIAERGGHEAYDAAMRGADGMRSARRVEFDLTPEGTMVPSSARITPPIDPRFAECVTAPLLDVDFGEVGASGAHVAVPLRAFRAREEARDGGVGR